MKMKKIVVLFAAIGMGATLAASSQQVVVQPTEAGGQGGYVVRRPIEARVLKGQPYAADVVNESTQTLSDGNRIVKRSTSRVYRDAEGRVRREDDGASGTPTITISDPVAGLSWTLDPATRTAREAVSPTTFMLRPTGAVPGTVTLRGGGAGTAGDPSARIAGSTDPQSRARAGGGGRGVGAGGGTVSAGAGGVTPSARIVPQLQAVAAAAGGRGVGAGRETVEEALPNKSIENLLCTGVRRTSTIPKGAIGNEQPIKIVSEEWTSIDLRVLVSTDMSDPRSGHVTYRLTNVRRGDPDATLFKVPADYTVTRGGGGRGRGGN